MAQLTTTLSDPQVSSTPISEDIPASTTGATVVDALAKGLGVFQAHIYKQAEQARATAAAQREATTFQQSQSDRAAQDAATRAAIGVNDALTTAPASTAQANPASPLPTASGLTTGVGVTDTGPLLSDAAQSSIDSASASLAKYQTAASQGTINPLAYAALSTQALHQVLAAHPEFNAAVVVDAFKKNGIDAFDAYNSAKTAADSKQAAENKAWSDNYAAGNANLAPELRASMTPDEIAASGQTYLVKANQLAAAKAAADMQIAKQSSNIAQVGFDQTQAARNQYQAASGQLDAALDAGLDHVMKQLTIAAPEGGVDPEFETRLAKSLPAARAYANTLVDKIVASTNPGSAGEASALRGQLMARVDSIFQPLQQRPQETANAVQAITGRLGISSSQAFPILTEMRRLGINVTMLPNVMSAIGTNAGLMSSLSAEINSVTKNPTMSPSLAQIHIDHVIGVLTGTQTLANVAGPQARQVVTQVASTFTTANADAVAAGKADGKMWLNSLGSVVNATGGLNRQSGADSLVTATRVIATPNNINAINALISNPATAEQARITANGSRSAAALLTSQLRQTAPAQAKSEAYIINWDTSNGRATLVPDTRAWNLAHPSSQRAATGVQSAANLDNPLAVAPIAQQKQPPPSVGLQQQVAALNSNVSYLAATAKWDANESKATPLQLKNHYGHNMDLPSDAQATPVSPGKQSYEPLFQQLDDITSKTPSIVATGTSRGDANNNQGNIVDGSFAKSQPGYVGSDGHFAKFATPEHGQAAQTTLLNQNYINKGVNTVSSIIDKYAPSFSHGGDNSPQSVANYKAYVAKRLNVDPNDTLSTDYTSRLAQAMREFETGHRNG